MESIARPKRRRPTIHSHLIRLVLACVVPVWLIAGFLVYHAYSSKRAVIKEHMLETARALTMSVDRELAIAQAALQTLSTSPVFDSGDSAGMHNQVLELLNFYTQADIIVADASGQQLVNSYKPFGTPLPKRNTPETVQRIFQYGKPIVSDLYFGAVTKRPLIAIDVPVFVNGQVAYDLSMTLPFNRLASILSQQRLPPEWFGTILDSKGVVVTRTRDPKLYVGKMAASDTRRAIAGSAEGIVEVTSLEGIRVFDAFSRSKTSNWTVVIGIPTSVAMKSMYSWLGWAIGCATILSLAGIALAMRIGNSIAHSIQSLVSPATAMGSGITIAALPPHSVRETECVAEALLQTSRLLEKRAAERDLAEAALKELNETLENRVVERTAALSASESTLRAILTQMPSGVTVRDARTGTIILSNSRSLEILGDLVEVPDQFSRYRGFHPDGSPIRTEEWPLSRSMTNGEIVKQEEVECEQDNCSRITLSISSVPIRDRNGAIVMGVAIFDDITKRKRSEEVLRESEEYLDNLFNYANAPVIVWDSSFCVTRFNHAFERLTGLKANEVIGKSLDILFPDTSKDESMGLIEKALSGERWETVEIPILHTDGSVRIVLWNSANIHDRENSKVVATIAQGQDITERKRVEQDLQESESRFRSMANAMPQLAWIARADGHIFWYNQRWYDYTGTVPEQMEGWGWQSVHDPVELPKVLERWQASIATGEPFEMIFPLRGADGVFLPFLTRGFPLKDTAGRVLQWFGTNTDVDELKRAEEQIKASLAEKDVLLREIHHRVKNNLQVISSLVSLQADGSGDETVREVLRDVTYRVRSMALVHEKLYRSTDLARIDFAEYIRGLLSYLWRAHGAVAANVRLALDLKPVSLPVDIAVPCGLILNELAGNALKHAFHGRSEGEVTVSLQNSVDGRIHLSVADNGVGLPAEFDWRETRSLGLRLVQMLSGQLDATVEASGEEGTRFEIVFSGL